MKKSNASFAVSTATNNTHTKSSTIEQAQTSHRYLDIISIFPTSDELYRRFIKSSSNTASSPLLECYYSSLRIERYGGRNQKKTTITNSIVFQTIHVGDIIPVRLSCDECDSYDSFAFSRREPFNTGSTKWGVGQVLSIHRQIDQTASTQTYHCQVKWFIPFMSPTAKFLLNSSDQKQLKVLGRPHFMLLEQQAISSVIDIQDQVLPGIILFDKIKSSHFKDSTSSDEIFDSCYEIPFFCKRHISTIATESNKCDDTDFCNSKTKGHIPNSLIRGWDHLQRGEPELFAPHSAYRTSVVIQRQDSCNINVGEPRFSISGTKRDNCGSCDHEYDVERETIVPTHEMSETEQVLSYEPKHPILSGRKQSSTIKSHQANLVSRNGFVSKRQRCTDQSGRKRPRDEKQNCLPVESRPGLKTTKRKDNSIDKENSKNESTFSIQEDSPESIPVGNVLFHHETKGKKKGEKANKPITKNNSLNRTSFLFYDSVQIKSDARYNVNKKQHSTMQNSNKSWCVHIGDVVAIACSDSKAVQPIYYSSNLSKQTIDERSLEQGGVWHPFNQPWSPAQVVAVYQKPFSCNDLVNTHKSSHHNDEVFLQVRWFYRPNELPEQVIHLMNPDQKKDLYLSTNEKRKTGILSYLYSGRHYIESDNCVTETFASSVLGRIATKELIDEHDLSWLSSFLSNDKIPLVPIICKYATFRDVEHVKATTAGFQAIGHTKTKKSSNKTESLLLPISFWSNYPSIMQGPLSRIMNCRQSFPFQIKKLRDVYESSIRRNFRVIDSDNVHPVSTSKGIMVSSFKSELCKESSRQSQATFSTSWPDDLLQTCNATTAKCDKPVRNSSGELLHATKLLNGNERRFFLRASAQLLSRRCDPRATGRKSTTDKTQWMIQIGDVVCVAKNGVPIPIFANGSSKKNCKKGVNPWFPFVGPWRVCQILNIYLDAEPSGNTSGTTLLEVRWLFRTSDLLLPWIPTTENAGEMLEDDFFETDVIENGIPLSHVIGGVDLLLGHHSEISNSGSHCAAGVPAPKCRCANFYFMKHESFQPIFCSEPQPKAWFKSFTERGMRLSSLIDDDYLLSREVECALNVKLKDEVSTNDFVPVSNFFGGLQASKKDSWISSGDARLLSVSGGKGDKEMHYFLSVSMLPQWDNFVNADIVCSKSDRSGIRWTLLVGDIVAVNVQKCHSFATNSVLFPFTCEWRPAQVLALLKNKTSTEMKVQLRILYRQSDHIFLKSLDTKRVFDSIYESDDVSTVELELESILGPITLVEDYGKHSATRVWAEIPKYLPAVISVYSGSFSMEHNCRSLGPSFQSLLQRGLEISGHYDDNGVKIILEALKNHMDSSLEMKYFCQRQSFLCDTIKSFSGKKPFVCSNEENVSTDTPYALGNASNSVRAFHTDKSNGTEYFHKLDVDPPLANYNLDMPNSSKQHRPVWTVSLGDLVALHCESNKCVSKAIYGVGSSNYAKGGHHWPFKVAWAVGEVVSIFRSAKEIYSDNMLCVDHELSGQGRLTLEIRWFYRASELQQVSNGELTFSEHISEELFETDHYDEVDASCLLAPIDLFIQPVTIYEAKSRIGMPVLDFFCQRFFSIHRKSLIPVAGLNGRESRGRAYSPRIGPNNPLKSSLDLLLSAETELLKSGLSSTISDPITPWETAFKDVVNKLSLTDASKEAYSNHSVLVGRTDERNEIISFIRSSLFREVNDASSPSIFVAGPPGVGKTASIRAAISELKHEQAVGKVPEFDFVALNGMEMRHPFEAYVKLWSEISGGEKQTLSAEIAASHLEDYFSGKKITSKLDKDRIVVVLLDEIDYLVTKKQTVLYNFFDWPLRSLETGSNRRIIVVGVSNTLNLPERLHTRVQSRIGSKRIFFKAYSFDETVSILTSKVKQASPFYTVFDPEAINLVGRKTAALSGDIRKAFHTCRCAAESVMNKAKKACDTSPIVKTLDIVEVTRDSANTAHARLVALCTPYQVLVVVALAALAKGTGRELGRFEVEEITTKMNAITNAHGDELYLPPPNFEETLGILSDLGEADLVRLETTRYATLSYRPYANGSGASWPQVSMSIDEHSVLQALKNTRHNALVQKCLVDSF